MGINPELRDALSNDGSSTDASPSTKTSKAGSLGRFSPTLKKSFSNFFSKSKSNLALEDPDSSKDTMKEATPANSGVLKEGAHSKVYCGC